MTAVASTEMPTSALQLLVKQLFLAHPQLRRVLDAIAQRVESRNVVGQGHGLLIVAPSNGGKTRLLEYLSAKYPRVQHPQRTVVPLVTVNVPNPCTPAGFASALLEALEGGQLGSKAELPRAEFLLSQAETSILAVDNTQDIPERRGPKGIDRVGNFIRDLIVKHRIIVLLLGTSAAEIVVNSNDQLRRRVPGKLSLCDYDITNSKGLGEYLRLIDLFDKALPLPMQSGLANGPVGKPLAFASNGRIGATADLIAAAIGCAAEQGELQLTLENFSTAYCRHYLAYADMVNPFVPGFNHWRRLDLPGEPHFDAHSWAAKKRLEKSVKAKRST
jgi:hypothetical protein